MMASTVSAMCHTPGPKKRIFTHSWTIEDFEAKTRTFKVGQSISSAVFTLGGQQAVVKVFPSGTVGNKNHVSIFLENQGQEPINISEIDFTFAPSSASPHTKSAPMKELRPMQLWGLHRVVPVQLCRDTLLAEDGALHLLTEIRREQERNSVSFETSSEGEGEGLGQQLWEKFRQGSLTDFTLVCDGQRLPCHRIVLGARSEFFNGLLSSGLSEGGSSEFTVTGTDRDTLVLLLEFLYTGEVQETPKKLEGQQVELLLTASDFYVVPGLKRQCEDWLIQSLDFTNMVDRLILGDTYSAARLRRLAKEMVVEDSKKLELIPDWKKKLAVRTDLVLEVLEGLARNAL